MDLIFRYARAGQTPEETKYPKRYQTCLNRCKSWIDVSVRKENPDIRFHASNQILLKIWPYLKKVICDTLEIVPMKELPEVLVKFRDEKKRNFA